MGHKIMDRLIYRAIFGILSHSCANGFCLGATLFLPNGLHTHEWLASLRGQLFLFRVCYGNVI